MQKFGIIENGKLKKTTEDTPGAKVIIYDDIPEFDQINEAIFESNFIEKEDYIFVEVEVKEVVQDNSETEGEMF
jgi:hypothetical protein